MKILFVLEYYYPHIGGVETFFQKLAEGLAQQNFSVTILTARIKNAPSVETINQVKINRIWVPIWLNRYWFTLLSFFNLLGKARQFDLIHTTTYNAALPAWLIAKIFRKKVVITVHEILGPLWFKLPEMNKFSATLHYWFEKIIIRLPFDQSIAVSDYTKQCLLQNQVAAKKIQRIYHGIDYQLFDYKKKSSLLTKQTMGLGDNFSYLFFGRPGWIKGLNYLIQAWPSVLKQVPQAKLILLISKEPALPYQALLKLIAKLQIDKNVLILNSVTRDKLPQYLQVADCVVIPSLSEGFGFSAAEAAAMEVPLVVSAVGSLPEVVSGKVIFSPPQNSQALAQALINAALQKYKIIPKKKFEWSAAIKAYIKLYQTL